MGLKNIIIELTVSNICKSIEFYTEIFGFNVEYSVGTPITWAKLNKNEQKIMLEDYKIVTEEIENYPIKVQSTNIIKFEVDSLEELNILYEKCKYKDCDILIDFNKTDYGKIEFGVYDLDKNLIIVSYEEVDERK
jgi:uncharacterized glyoxalase superfamily protein PhnB